jgi:hypothetical protein
MKILRRRLFIGLASLSLLLCVTSIAAFLGHGTFSKSFGDWVGNNKAEVDIAVDWGILWMRRTNGFGNYLTPKPGEGLSGGVANYKQRELWGFAFTSGDMQQSLFGPNGEESNSRRIIGHVAVLEVSLVWVTLVTAVLPIWWGIRCGRNWLARRKNASPHSCE